MYPSKDDCEEIDLKNLGVKAINRLYEASVDKNMRPKNKWKLYNNCSDVVLRLLEEGGLSKNKNIQNFYKIGWLVSIYIVITAHTAIPYFFNGVFFGNPDSYDFTGFIVALLKIDAPVRGDLSNFCFSRAIIEAVTGCIPSFGLAYLVGLSKTKYHGLPYSTLNKRFIKRGFSISVIGSAFYISKAIISKLVGYNQVMQWIDITLLSLALPIYFMASIPISMVTPLIKIADTKVSGILGDVLSFPQLLLGLGGSLSVFILPLIAPLIISQKMRLMYNNLITPKHVKNLAKLYNAKKANAAENAHGLNRFVNEIRGNISFYGNRLLKNPKITISCALVAVGVFSLRKTNVVPELLTPRIFRK